MNRKAIGGIVLVLGVVLLAYGISAADSLASELSEFFQGTPTDKSILLLVLGGVMTALGGFAVLSDRT